MGCGSPRGPRTPSGLSVVGDWNDWSVGSRPTAARRRHRGVGGHRRGGGARRPLQARHHRRSGGDVAAGRPDGGMGRGRRQRQPRLHVPARVGRRGVDETARRSIDPARMRLSAYEVHLGSWRRHARRRPPLLPRAGSAPGRPRRRPRVHPRRAHAGGRAPLRAVVGLPGHRLLRPHRSRTATRTTSGPSSTTSTSGGSA